MVLILFLLLLFNNRQTYCEESSSILLIKFIQFHNPTGITADGRCCNGSSPTLGLCPTPSFCHLNTVVCLDFVNSKTRTDWNSCRLGTKSIRTKINDTNLFNYYSIQGIDNILPLQFELPHIVDDSIIVKIFVFYDGIDSLLNQFHAEFNLDRSMNRDFEEIQLTSPLESQSYINHMILSLKIFCRPTFYGQRCSTQCIPNDDCTSSYTCDFTTGQRICAPGWYGIDCSIRNPSSTCLSSGLTCHNGGFCRHNQSTCCCAAGFTGTNCQYLSTCVPSKTCLNGGTCSSIYDSDSRTNYFVCNCLDSYTGLYCQEKPRCPSSLYGPNCDVECIPANTCSQGHYYCDSNGEKICLHGWGPNNICTQKMIPPILDRECSTSTGCLNGGSCFSGRCCCPATYTGSLCEIAIDPCANNSCQNNALCLSTSTGYKCLCASSMYTGSLCEIYENPCQHSPCQNGICQAIESTGSFGCSCYPGYTDALCQTKIDHCLSQPCENKGICSSIGIDFVCTCLTDFTGPTCSIPLRLCDDEFCGNNYVPRCRQGLTGPPNCLEDIDECSLEKDLCKNGGECINTYGSYQCSCHEPYQGSDCSTPVDPCVSNPCLLSNSISCTSIISDSSYSIDFNCTCRQGFTGAHCEIELDPCATNPCFNGACHAVTPLTWSCACEPGWTGVRCQDGINECLSNPCLNAGVCVDDVNGYHCQCLTGFSGPLCQIDVDLCSSTPCQNNGTCINNVDSHSCLCSNGWTGHICEQNINECLFPLSCHPNATCIDVPGSYQCVCPPWLTGTNCLTTIDQCEQSPCLNDGVCVNNFASLPTCHCPSGFTGVYCEINIDDCQAAPCDNNGTCIDQVNSFVCLCSSGYTGLRCQTAISQCNSLPCINGGTCRDSSFGDSENYTCLCPPFFTGKQCEKIINPCLSFPCLHGSCIPSGPTYSCRCNIGYTGHNCETMIDQCISRPCGSHGNCTSLSTTFTCCCAPGYTGSQCEQLIDICATNPCSIEGAEACYPTASASFACLCKPGYSGRYCEVNVNECLTKPCLHGGVCIDSRNGYQCICPLTYTGVNCELLQDKCLENQCLNGGHCINDGVNLTCSCSRGYHGENCELIVDYCQSQPCSNGGVCTNTAAGPKCKCANGITGVFCETIVDHCRSSPCQNFGTCKSLIDKYVCLCSNGYMGDRCETERNECEPVNPCLNSGRCIDGFNNFTCLCNEGFTGFYCETQIDRCQSNPCLNGGICRTLVNSFKCDCPQGYQGSTCSVMVNHCLSKPCLNDGLCISLVNNYRCVCRQDYIGSNCEKQSDECTPSPCLNNGVCIDHVWNYTCRCPNGFTGSNCQTRKNHCDSNPCVHGLCMSQNQGYRCVCPSPSYSGVNCEIHTDRCSPNPCLSGGKCIDGLDRFTCICPPWFSGLTCAERIDPCSTQTTCANNGTCITDLSIKPYGFRCRCSPGHTGQMCEINVDDCVSQPCKHGRCIDRINGFICECYSAYSGIFCDKLIDHCSSSPCQNGGTCQSLVGTYQCFCPSDYQGINCEEKVLDRCKANECLNNGTCTSIANNDFQCKCPHGYAGKRCDKIIDGCDASPCHHGTCRSIPNGFYSCLCEADYTGFDCNIELSPCDSLPCLNNGICNKISSDKFSCACPNGYSGKQCQFIDYGCKSEPCLNNGKCISDKDGYRCECPLGLTGDRCETDVNECLSMPCRNNGMCVQTNIHHYKCVCQTGYTGTHCEIHEDPCLSMHCLNNGLCMRANLTTAICSCMAGYVGSLCQHQINTCASAPCLNGTCVPLVNSYQCNCFPGYTGKRCDTSVNYCSANSCYNNGTCINQATSFACQCPYGFQGRTCVIRVQSCQSSPCLNGGTCHDVAPGLHKCSCPTSFHGEFCQLRDSFCLNAPCRNHGLCLDTLNGYQCVCRPGYSGVNCTDEIQPCLSNPCSNGATCRNTNNGLSYQCLCKKGYAGLQCEIEMNWCSSNPCRNQGTCISELTSFTCLCSPLYTGRICQTPINVCSLAKCQHGVPHLSSPTNCSCTCSDGYTGLQCDVPINPCLSSSYCVRGTCNYLAPGIADCTCPAGYGGLHCDTKLSNGVCSSCPCFYGKCRTLENSDDYECDCYKGYTGKQCNISIDLCKPTPCLYGQCFFDDADGYRCQCLTGAYGRNCSILNDTCGSNPCLNNGVCIQGLNTYQCVCQSGYAGIHCEILINQCTSLTCLNNGTCINLETKPPSAKCQCPSSYTGAQCQHPYAPCASNPCQNLGTCLSEGPSSYKCVCLDGFTGVNCDVPVHVCDSHPCLNQGKCIQPAPYYYLCQCPWPFYGINCELNYDPCLSSPCQGSSSQCIPTPEHHNYTCICSSDADGLACSIPRDPCSTSPCENGGSCVRAGALTYGCSCPPGYEGRHCEIEIDPCWNHTCIHGVAVRTSLIDCECQCSYSYYGRACEMSSCGNDPCLVGQCIPKENFTYTCDCPPGFQFLMGKCSDINECRSNTTLCSHGGRCLNTYGSYSCFCKTGFYGENCEIYDPCRSVNCLNGGSCEVNENFPYWQCHCSKSHFGKYCEIFSPGCSLNPCRTGTCMNIPDGDYECLCPPGITGRNCDSAVLPCDSNPCLNNATCLSLSLTNYTCACPLSLTGPKCAERRTLCSENTCHEDAICIIDHNSEREVCLCPPGRFGMRCEIEGPCASKPCTNGICLNKNATAFECKCNYGFKGDRCDVPYNVCETNPCANGGTCSNLGRGLFHCVCRDGFTGSDCSVYNCTKTTCFNGGVCSSHSRSPQCQCPCGFTGMRCETPIDVCALTICQNNGTRVFDRATCQCTCLCSPPFTGSVCQSPAMPINRTYAGRIVIPINRPGGSSWEAVSQCIDQVWNSLNVLLVCPSPFNLATPTSFYPYCYRLSHENSLKNQQEAMEHCEKQGTQLVWFRSIDELEQQLLPALHDQGSTRDFWTSGVYNSMSNRWQWLISKNTSLIDIAPSMAKQIEANSKDQSLYVSFDQSKNQHLVASPSSELYSTLCKISATRHPLNDHTRSIDRKSYKNTYINQTNVIIYDFDYTILPTVPLNTPIYQPTDTEYVNMCSAFGSPTTVDQPYTIDICGYFSSSTDQNVELIMDAISAYYSKHRVSSMWMNNSYIARAQSVEHYLTITGNIMTRIHFVINSESAKSLGSNMEPFVSISDILDTIKYQNYEQCVPHISLNILLQLKFCIPMNEISLWNNLIARAVSEAIEQSNVNVMLKGVQEGVTTTGQPANIAYFLIMINGVTYNKTTEDKLSNSPILMSAIRRDNERLLCPKDKEILLFENSIQNFFSTCTTPLLLKRQLNYALNQAGIHTMNVHIFGIDKAINNLGQVYDLPNIFLQHVNGTWLHGPLELNDQLYQVLVSNQLQSLTNRVYHLSKAFSFFYLNQLSMNDRYYLQQLVLVLHNQQSPMIGNNVKILFEDFYFNKISLQTFRRVYSFVFFNEELLDGRYLSSLVLPEGQFSGIHNVQNPLGLVSNEILTDAIKQRDSQVLAVSGKMNKLSAERILQELWQNTITPGLENAFINIIEVQEYLARASNQFFTTIAYTVMSSDSYVIPNICFNPTMLSSMPRPCSGRNQFIAQIPDGYIPSFIDLQGYYTRDELDNGNFITLLNATLGRIGITGEIMPLLTEKRFGLDMSVITRVYYTIIPFQVIQQEQLQDQFNSLVSTSSNANFQLHPIEQLSVLLSDTHQYIANVSLPISESTRTNIENYLTAYNSQYGKARTVHTEVIDRNHTRFYLIFVNEAQLITNCDFDLYYAGAPNFEQGTIGVNSLYLDRNSFITKSFSLGNSLAQLWKEENAHQRKHISVQLKSQIQYICSTEQRFVQINYIIKNASIDKLKPPSSSKFDEAYGKPANNCVANEVRSLYLIEPRLPDKSINEELESAWRRANRNASVKISSVFFSDSSYLTKTNQTLTRVIYTVNSTASKLVQPLPKSIGLTNIYTDIPYKQYTVHIENKPINSTVLSMINKALRLSWAKANSYLFSPNDLSLQAIHTEPSDNGQINVHYTIGLRLGDIDDYSQPSELIYAQTFNETDLSALVPLRYLSRAGSDTHTTKYPISLFPFGSRIGGISNELSWWIILIIIIFFITTWLVLCLICYKCAHKRSNNHRYQHKISKHHDRNIDVLAREQDPYLRPSLASLAFEGPYTESMNSLGDDHQRASSRATSSQPELQVRRLSEQDWPHFAMHNPYGWSTLLSNSPSPSNDLNTRPF